MMTGPPRSLPIVGSVTSEDGAPVPFAELLFVSEYGGSHASALTESDGTFETEPMPLGSLLVWVTAPGFQDRHTSVKHPQQSYHFALRPGATVVVEASVETPCPTAGMQVEALLAAGPSHKASPPAIELPGLPIQCFGDGAAVYAAQQPVVAGSFRLRFPGVAPCVGLTLVLRVGPFVPIRREYAAFQSKIALPRLPLEPGLRLTGRVTDPLSFLAAGGEGAVQVSTNWFWGVHVSKIAIDGRFEIVGVPPEPLEVSIRTWQSWAFHRPLGPSFVGKSFVVDPRDVPDGDLGVIQLGVLT